ncbi:hypothetical protein D3C76_1652000 [compost metagenome]
MVAPKAAPDETPKTNGSPIGFLNNPWNVTPLIANPAPVNSAIRTLGALIFIIIFSLIFPSETLVK